jgi:hypothetical protein
LLNTPDTSGGSGKKPLGSCNVRIALCCTQKLQEKARLLLAINVGILIVVVKSLNSIDPLLKAEAG